MALTTVERTSITKLVVAMFNAAPGANYLAELTSVYEANGRSLSNLAQGLAQTTAYKNLNPNFQTGEEFAAKFLTPLGLQANSEAKDFVIAKFNAGVSKGQIALDAATALSNYTGTATDLVAAKAILANKTAAAEFYSIDLNVQETDLADLQAAIAQVTANPASVNTVNADNTASQAPIVVTKQFTVGQDQIFGSNAADVFKANVVQNPNGYQVNSLGSGDQLVGGGGTDTLLAKVTAGAFVNGNGNLNLDLTIGGQQIPVTLVGSSTMPIQPETSSVEIIKFEAVSANVSGLDTQVYINAKDMVDVRQMWSNHSDADLVIQNLTTLGVGSTVDQTIGMAYSGSKDSRWGASDMTVYYDQDYLVPAGSSLTSAIEIRIVNNLELATNNKGLVAFQRLSFLVGDQEVIVNITPEITALQGAAAYNALVVAIQAQLASQGITDVTVTTLPTRTAVFTDDLGGFLQGAVAGSYTPIVVTSTAAPLTRGLTEVDNTTLNFNGLNTQLFASESRDLLLTVNVALEKVGLAGDGGELIIGSMNKTSANEWNAVNTVTDTKSGIEQFNVTVFGANDKSSSLAGMHSTNNNLRVVNVVTDAAQTGSFANLTIGNSNTRPAVPFTVQSQLDSDGIDGNSGILLKSSKLVDVPDDNNQFALKDVQTFNAAGLKGDLTLFAALTQEVTEKYLNVTDFVANPATDNVNFAYTSGIGNDYINLFLDPANLAQPGSLTREDMTLTISTGLGNDEVLVSTGDFFGESGGSNDNWYENQHINANLKMAGGLATGQLQINTGDGVDTVRVLGQGDYAINTGAGNDTVYADNTGNKSIWAINAVNDDPNNLLSQAAVAAAPKIANLSLNVSFKGYDAKVNVGASNNSTTGVNVTDLTINQAIKDAINNNEVLNKLLVAKDGPGRTLVITSLIDGNQSDLNDINDVVISLSSTALTPAQTAATLLSPAQALALGFGVATASGFGATLGGRFDADEAFNYSGSPSTAASDNLIVGGVGSDVIVLGTGGNSNDTVGYAGFGNGTDTIVNFSSQNSFTTVVNTADVTSISQGNPAVAAAPGVPDSFTLQLTGTVAVAPGTFTLDNAYMGGLADVSYVPAIGATAAQVATGLAAANNAAANGYTAVATGDSVTFTQNVPGSFGPVANPTLGNTTASQVSYDGSGIGVVNLTGTTGSAAVIAAPASGTETFTVFFGDDTVFATSYTFDGVSVPVLVGETGANIAASFASAFTNAGADASTWDVLAYTPGDNSVTFSSETVGDRVDVTDASFVGANVPNTVFGLGSAFDRLDFTSYASKAVLVNGVLVAGVAAAAGQTYISLVESTTNAGEYLMTQFTEAGAVDVAVGIIGIADFGATQAFAAQNFVI